MMLRPRWVLALLGALAVAAAFALLGQWQFERAIDSGEVVQRTTEEPLPLQQTAQPGGPTSEKSTGQKVTATGRFVPGDEQLITGRLNGGVHGYWVVSHFVTAPGSSGVPVARGWTADRGDAEAAMRSLAGDETEGLRVGAAGTTVSGRFLPAEAPAVPEEGGDPHAMSTVSVAALINLWENADDSVYAGYIVDDQPPAGLEAIDSPVPENEVAVNWLNVFYAAEWAVFAGFAVFLWYRLVRDAYERQEEEALPPPTDPVEAGPASPGT
jgi:cytochrome oxidase assembly protein ShyY1